MRTILDITPEEVTELFNVLGLDEEGELKYEITGCALIIEADNSFGSEISIYPNGYIGCMRKDDNQPDTVENIKDVYEYLWSIDINPLGIETFSL